MNGVYTQSYNRRHRKVGHLFQGRFKAIVIEAERYFLEVCRYVELNPVRAGMVKRPDAWRWSSYRAHTGRAPSPAWLDSAAVHRHVAPRAPRREGPRRYAEFVAQGRGVKLWEESLSGQIYLGSEAFVKRLQARAGSGEAKEIPRAQRRPTAPPLASYFSAHARDAAIVGAYREGGYAQSAIAAACGLSVARVSRLTAAHEAKGKT